MTKNDLPFIPVAAPSITEREGELAREAALTAWGSNHYQFNERFEQLFADYLEVGYATSLPHATAGLHLALAAAGIGPGDEVIGPDITWIASMAPVNYVGATPVFADILPDTWCINPAAVNDLITPRTRAIIGVDLYGSLCDWTSLREIADRHNLILIEDAAGAIGSKYFEKMAGSFGDLGIFPFHGSKSITTGEGGMIVTNDAALNARIQTLRDHGRPPGDRFFQNSEIAYKYKMSSVQAALGIAQMERVESLIDQKRQIFNWYQERLHSKVDICLNYEPENVKNSYWMVTVVPQNKDMIDKFSLQAELAKKQIDSRPFFSRLSTLLPYKEAGLKHNHLLGAETTGHHATTHGLNLPSGYNMTEELVERVCLELINILDL